MKLLTINVIPKEVLSFGGWGGGCGGGEGGGPDTQTKQNKKKPNTPSSPALVTRHFVRKVFLRWGVHGDNERVRNANCGVQFIVAFSAIRRRAQISTVRVCECCSYDDDVVLS